MQEPSETFKQSNPPRRWHQFSLLTILIIMSCAAIILAINFWPPKVRSFDQDRFDKNPGVSIFHVEQGWPFEHLDYWARGEKQLDDTPLDRWGWPLDLPAPPKATNWSKLVANIFVLTAMGLFMCWICKWLWDVCRALKLKTTGPQSELERRRWIPAAILCVVGVTTIVWAVEMTRCFSLNEANGMLTEGNGPHPSDFKFLLLPPFYLIAGLLALDAARHWLWLDPRRVKMTFVVFLAFLLLAATDSFGRSVLVESFAHFPYML